VILPEFPTRSIHLLGTLSVGGKCRIEGTNEIAWGTQAVLLDITNTALDMVALGIKTVRDITYMIRPRIIDGDGTTLLTIALLMTTTGHS
jgi:signal transduction histidine kinase